MAIAALAALAFVVPSLQGQVIGVKGGLNFADVSIQEESGPVETDTEEGIIAGVFASFGLNDVLSLRPELLLAQKGTEVSDGSETISAELTYLEIPVLVSAGTTSGSFRPSVYAGPVISFETGCTLELEIGETEESSACDADDEDPILTKSTDFGLAFGVGLSLDTGNLIWMLDGRYTLGLSDINDIPDAPETLKNRAFSIMAGVGIRLN